MGPWATTCRSPSRRRVLEILGASAVAATLPGASSRGQESSSKSVRIIVPFAPGAAVDVVARILAVPLSTQWSKSVIVENRPGGLTLIAAELVARSEPDGDTLLFCLDDTFTIVPYLAEPGSIDPMKELVPINLVGTIPMVFVVNPSLPVDTIPALIAYARNNPTALSYGSAGEGSLTHLAMEVFKAEAKIDIVHVPYRGLAPVQTAVMAGEVQMAILGYGSSRGMIEAGRLRAIAIPSPARVASLPNVPTMAELGYPRVDATSRLTIAGPARMSEKTIDRVNGAVSHVLEAPETRKLIEARDIVVTDMGPKPFAEEIRRLSLSNGEAAKISGVKRR